MSVAASEAVARVAAIQQKVAQLAVGTGSQPAPAAFATALQSAQGAPSAQPASATAAAASAVPFGQEIVAAATRHGVDPALLAALVKQESGFNPAARSPAGAVGLTQLMPGTARELGVRDPTDPLQALDGGARYLRQQLDRFRGDERLALAAYNAGPGAVQRFGGVPPYAETQNYVKVVLAARDAYAATGLAGAPAVPAGGPLPGGLSPAAMAAQTPAMDVLRTTLDSPSTSGPTGSSSPLPYPTT